ESVKMRGRPREFDADKALDQALRIFWKHGYEGASLPELTRAMGINRPSMYAAFGNKEALFRKAVERYMQMAGGWIQEALEQPTGADAAALAKYVATFQLGLAVQSAGGATREELMAAVEVALRGLGLSV